MHVAHFIQRYPPAVGGSETYFARLGGYLAAGGDDVTVWTTTAVDLEAFWRKTPGPPDRDNLPAEVSLSPSFSALSGGEPGSITVRRYPPLVFPGRRYVLKALTFIPSRPWQCLTMPCNPICPGMWRDAGRYAGLVDAVHATAFPYAFPMLCGLRLARRRGVPFFLTPFLHLGDAADGTDRTRRQYTAPQLRWLLRQADYVFVQTRLEHDAVSALGVPKDRIVLQGLGVEAEDCTGGDRDAARREWEIAPGEVVVGHLANASVEKGTVDLLRAAERAWASGCRFRVVLAGPEMANFRTFWDRFAPKTRVTRLGVLTAVQKRDFFAGIDVFALPSRSDSFGLVLLEAWANGKPNLVYRAGGPAELVRDGIDGMQVRCGDIEGLATKLGELSANDQLRRKLGETGCSRIDREFAWSDKLGLVRDVMHGARPASTRRNPIRTADELPAHARRVSSA
ncbi:MAG: glycosyltransferase family 1 protein [Gemmataceae bacterium]|nr:glycosyltransferase family 1 protein [Gemmataceae bacterium]